MSAPSADRNLLFGILAVQMDFITRDQLVTAMHAWVLKKARPLGEILVEQNALPKSKRDLLEPLVDQHVKDHANDPARSLAALSSIDSGLPRELGRIDDVDVQGSVGLIPSMLRLDDDPNKTGAYASVGQSSSAGTRFRIIRPHATGGLGQVSVAEDIELHRQVALKEIQHRFADDANFRSRFVVEAEITGGLEHPGIVPVYGLGNYADGRPFYVMRFIRGDNLHDAIKRFHASGRAGRVNPPMEEHASDPMRHRGVYTPRSPRFDGVEFRKLLQRFIDVCNAIAYAHSRGVLHRDLKPGNVMLGKYGETLIVDWGLAKAGVRGQESGVSTEKTDTQEREPTLRPHAGSGSTPTVHGQALGTPGYMSPEQAAGLSDQLGQASDIYSVGATLYHVLTGTAPFSGDTGEILAKVQRGDFRPPRQVNPQVPRALEAICLKAMGLKPADRYDSALALAADVEHWLADEAVAAFTEPLTFRARRWMRKHSRLVSATTALLLTALVASGIGLAAVEHQRQKVVDQEKVTANERDRAVAARNRTRQALDDMVSEVTCESLATQLALSNEQKKFLENVLKYYEEFAAEPGQDRAGRERLARAHFDLGMIRSRLGQKTEGEQVLRIAITLYDALAADFTAVPAYRQSLALSHNNLGILLYDLAKLPEAEAAFRAALGIQQKLAAEFPAVPEYRKELAGSHTNLGVLLADLGKRPEEEAAYRAALAIQQELAADFPAVPEYRKELARSHNNLGILLKDFGNGPQAEAAFRAALGIQQELAADFPAVPEYLHALAVSQNNLGALLARLGKRPEAEAAHRAALAIHQKLAADFPAVPAYRLCLGDSHYNLGHLLAALGKRPEAEAADRAAVAILEKLAADFPDVPEYPANLARSQLNLGNLLASLGRLPQAEAAYRAALVAYEKLAAEFPGVTQYRENLAMSHNNLGLQFAGLGKRPEAESAHRAAVAIREKLAADFPAVPEYRENLAWSHYYLAQMFAQAGQVEGAAKAHRRVAELSGELVAKFPERSDLRIFRANALALTGEHVNAVAEANVLTGGKQASAETVYQAACVFAISSTKTGDDKALDERYATRAVELLRQAVGKGYTNFAHIMKDEDLAPLCGRDDFAALLWDIAEAAGCRQ